MNKFTNMKRASKKICTLLLSIGIVCYLLFGHVALMAQPVPPAIMAQINAELQKRGLTENEVRVRLLQKGIDLENTPTAELPKYQARVIAVLDELQAEKSAGKGAGSVTMSTVQPGVVNVVNPEPIPVTTSAEAAAEASQRVIQSDAKTEHSAIYGHSMFTDHSLDVFRTTDGAQAPDTYVLGEGDEIRISIFGASQTDIQQKIALDGSIQPTGVAKIFLKGITLAQARDLIRERLASAYTFRSDQFAVTIVTARTIMVTVFGEAKITGGFNLSALNSAINALSAAGGPTEIGSVRSIQLIRGNNRKPIDLYAFMNDPAIQFKFDLQNNDILFVPVLKSLVSVEGAVKRPMSYEMVPGETLSELIRYAGGVKMDVFPDFVQIQRYVDGEERLMEWNLGEVLSGNIKVPLLNGDVVRIKSIAKPMDQYVEVAGSVYYPGRFDLSSNGTLRTLLANAKPTFQAKTDMLFVERIRPDETIELLSLPFPVENSAISDFVLKPRDRVRVLDQASYRDVATISVSGQVRLPFEKTLGLDDRITVKQAIDLAGGLKSSVYPVAYIFRKNLFNTDEVKYIRIELDQADNIELQAGDRLNIYDNSTYTNIGEVRIFGAVKNPGGYTYDPTLSIRDLITNAGGFNVGAAFNRVEVFRTILSPTEKTRLEMVSLEVDSNYQVVSPVNFVLQPYDQVAVRLTPEFTLGRTVEISGQVVYPGTYVLESKQVQLSDIIEMAGGLLDDADPYGTRLFRTYKNRGNVSVELTKAINRSHSTAFNPILFEGDVININRLENTVTIRENGTRMAQYSINPEYSEVKNVVYQGSRSADWYIKNFAGGYDKEADRNSVTVTLPNNQMRSTKKFLFIRSYPTVESGSIISMQMKPIEIVEKKEKKPVDWNAIWSSTMAATTTLISIFLLIDRMAPANSAN
jgi:protein involved in polysaccharide export with SLBB domain